jgi:Ca2+/H+ antiporter
MSALGGVLGHLTDPAVNVLNSVSGLPAEWRAAQIAVHTAIVCAFLAVTAYVLVVVTRRRAHRGEIRQIVQEELRRPATEPESSLSG